MRICTKSYALKRNELVFLENVWKEFEEDTRNKGAKSIVKVASFKAETDENVPRKMCKVFSTVQITSLLTKN